MDSLGLSRDEVLDRRLLFFHKLEWVVAASTSVRILEFPKNQLKTKAGNPRWFVRVERSLVEKETCVLANLDYEQTE